MHMTLKMTTAARWPAGTPPETGSLLWVKWGPVAVTVSVPVVFRPQIPAWIWMWATTLELYFAAKWLTSFRYLFLKKGFSRWRLAAYWFLWPGMNARAFLLEDAATPPASRDWVLAGAKALFGAILLWFGVRLVGLAHPLIAGWTGMVGLVLLLHFGLFHLVALLWRKRGVNAKPLMHSPITATSLGEFWSARWNTGFSDLMRRQVYKGLARNCGAGRAVFAVFIVSGLLHELVLSFPARAGYGLPTLYFVIQCAGLFFERSNFGRQIGLGHGWPGRCFTIFTAGATAFWLFPPIFIQNVILPMLHAIAAI